jgi:hypothetical protein
MTHRVIDGLLESWFIVTLVAWIIFLALYLIVTSPLILWRRITHQQQETLGGDGYD